MMFDGKAFAKEIAAELHAEVSRYTPAPSLGVVMVGENPVSKRYVGLKKKMATEVGVTVEVHTFNESITTSELENALEPIFQKHDGVIVQLPLPAHIDTPHILNKIPVSKDVDLLGDPSMDAFFKGETALLPPVVAVFAEIIQRKNIPVAGATVVVVGHGRLVGKPAAHWFRTHGAKVTVIDKGDSLQSAAPNADIIALGAGVPGILKKEMVKDGVVVLDAGTSEDGGALKGDAEPDVLERASLFTPVPGGIGPVTVVLLFRNLITLYKHGSKA